MDNYRNFLSYRGEYKTFMKYGNWRALTVYSVLGKKKLNQI